MKLGLRRAALAAAALAGLGLFLWAPCTNAVYREDEDIIVPLNARDPSALVMGPAAVRGLERVSFEKP